MACCFAKQAAVSGENSNRCGENCPQIEKKELTVAALYNIMIQCDQVWFHTENVCKCSSQSPGVNILS